MSVSRQSLARTRDKRVPKIPARFDDFSEIPPSTYLRNYLRENQKNIENTSASPFHPSITFLTTSSGTESFKEHQQIRIHPVEEPEPQEDPEPQAATLPTTPPAPATIVTTIQAPAAVPLKQQSSNTNPSVKKLKTKAAVDATPSKSDANVTPIINQATTKIYHAPKYTPTTMQYGTTRLMLNEPIYLPRSVATIAPITTTYEQIVCRMRKPPFLSRKAEACMEYQDERKLDYILSLHSTLSRIAGYLEADDLLNLRAVSRKWRAVVDSSSNWRRVVMGPGLGVKWKIFYCNIVDRYSTKTLVLDDYTVERPRFWQDHDKIIEDAITLSRLLLPNDGSFEDQSIRQISMTSTELYSNSFALALLVLLYRQQNDFYSKKNRDSIQITWNVKVLIDSDGVAKFSIPSLFAEPFLLALPKWLSQIVESRLYLTEIHHKQSNVGLDERLIDFYELKETIENILFCSDKANTLKTVITAI